jgi:biopolymer transport protein ExbD
MRVRRQRASEATLNLAPMIDVVFLLLIFFMVATTFVDREKEMDVDLPQAESGEQPEKEQDEIVINLLADGRMMVDGREVTREELDPILLRAARRNAETPVTIRGDREAVVERLVHVMDACRLAGLSNLGLMTLDG